jgi:hypothetical protein
MSCRVPVLSAPKPVSLRDWREIAFTFIIPRSLPQNWCKRDNVSDPVYHR